MAETLSIHKIADKTSGERVARFDPETGERRLLNPATPGDEHEPWPLAGVEFVGDPPSETRVPTGYVDNARREGWIVLEGARPVVRPGGPPEDPYRVDPAKGIPHVFVHADAMVFKTVHGDVRYSVTRNPDKWHDGPEGTDAVGDPTARVEHFYTIALEV